MSRSERDDHPSQQAINEDGLYFFASVLGRRDGQGSGDRTARLATRYAAFFGFVSAVAVAVDTLPLDQIRFTHLPSVADGVLVLRNANNIWSSDGRTLNDGTVRYDDDVRVTLEAPIALADIERLVFIPAEDVHGDIYLRVQLHDSDAGLWSGTSGGGVSSFIQIRVLPQPEIEDVTGDGLDNVLHGTPGDDHLRGQAGEDALWPVRK